MRETRMIPEPCERPRTTLAAWAAAACVVAFVADLASAQTGSGQTPPAAASPSTPGAASPPTPAPSMPAPSSPAVGAPGTNPGTAVRPAVPNAPNTPGLPGAAPGVVSIARAANEQDLALIGAAD